jgi:DNA-binding NarL/FixJ family response regulator
MEASPALASCVADLATEPESERLVPLSRAEREVVQLMLQGESNGAIAFRRGTSVRTIANQLSAAYRKLGVGSRAELARAILPSDSRSLSTMSERWSMQGLTPRECQVAAYVATGHSNKQVAITLGLSVSTAGAYAASAMHKLGVTTRVELVRRCAVLAQRTHANDHGMLTLR